MKRAPLISDPYGVKKTKNRSLEPSEASVPPTSFGVREALGQTRPSSRTAYSTSKLNAKLSQALQLGGILTGEPTEESSYHHQHRHVKEEAEKSKDLEPEPSFHNIKHKDKMAIDADLASLFKAIKELNMATSEKDRHGHRYSSLAVEYPQPEAKPAVETTTVPVTASEKTKGGKRSTGGRRSMSQASSDEGADPFAKPRGKTPAAPSPVSLPELAEHFAVAFRPTVLPDTLPSRPGTSLSMTDGASSVAPRSQTPQELLVNMKQYTSIQRRATKDYVQVMMHQLRHNKDLRGQFDSNLTESVEVHKSLKSAKAEKNYRQENVKNVTEFNLRQYHHSEMKKKEKVRQQNVYELHEELLRVDLHQKELSLQDDAAPRGAAFARDRLWLTHLRAVNGFLCFASILNMKRLGTSLDAPEGGERGKGTEETDANAKKKGAMEEEGKRGPRQEFVPVNVEAMGKLVHTLTNRGFHSFVSTAAERNRQRAVTRIINLLRAWKSFKDTFTCARSYLNACRRIIHMSRNFHYKCSVRKESLARQFEFYQMERLHYSRAICCDAERELKKIKALQTASSPVKSEQNKEAQHLKVMTPPKAKPTPSPLNPSQLQQPQPQGGASPRKATPASTTSTMKKQKSQATVPNYMIPRPHLANKEEFNIARQLSIPLLEADTLRKRFGRLGPDPSSARIAALQTLQLLNFDKVPMRVSGKIKNFLLEFVRQRERMFYMRRVQDYMFQYNEAKLRYESLEQVATMGKQHNEAVLQQIKTFTWPAPPYWNYLITPNEMRLIVLIGYDLSCQEKNRIFELQKQLDEEALMGLLSSSPLTSANPPKPLLSEAMMMELLDKYTTTTAVSKLTGIRNQFVGRSPFRLWL